MPGHRKTAAATRLTANRSLSAPPARVSITKRNRNSSRTARTRPRRGLHDVTASQSLHAAIPQKRLITERQWRGGDVPRLPDRGGEVGDRDDLGHLLDPGTRAVFLPRVPAVLRAHRDALAVALH